MLSAQLLILFVGSAIAARDATIFVDSTVVVIKPLSEVTLPCSYTTDDPDAPVIIRWERDHRDGPAVLWKSSNGRILLGSGYKTIAELGENCSLILKNPEPELSGTYTVTVDVHTEVSRDVQLFVFNENTTLRVNMTEEGGYMYNGGVTCATNTADEERVSSLVLGMAVALESICILLLGVCLFRRRNIPKCRHNRKPTAEEDPLYDDGIAVIYRADDGNRPTSMSSPLIPVHTLLGKSLHGDSQKRSRLDPQSLSTSPGSGICTGFPHSATDTLTTVKEISTGNRKPTALEQSQISLTLKHVHTLRGNPLHRNQGRNRKSADF